MSNHHEAGDGNVSSIAASVIIPAYQAAEFVQAAIQSALAQTRRDIEVIAVDDGSSDGTWDAVVACARHDGRVVPVRQPRRTGPAAARNAAIARARGRWLALLDADDLYTPYRLEHMIAAAEALDADLLADNLLQIDFATGAALGRRFREATMTRREPVTLIEAVRRDMPGSKPQSEMFGFLQPIMRRDFLLERGISYTEDMLVGEDFLLYFECIAQGGRFHLMPAAYYIQRLRSASLSTNREAMLHLSIANRRMLGIAPQPHDPELAALQHHRQRLIDLDCFALLLERGQIGAAMSHAHCGSPGRLLRHARTVAGTVYRHFGTLAATPSGKPEPVQDNQHTVTQLSLAKPPRQPEARQ